MMKTVLQFLMIGALVFGIQCPARADSTFFTTPNGGSVYWVGTTLNGGMRSTQLTLDSPAEHDCFNLAQRYSTVIVRRYEVTDTMCITGYTNCSTPGGCSPGCGKTVRTQLYCFPCQQRAMDWLNADKSRLDWDIVGIFSFGMGQKPQLKDKAVTDVIRTWSVQ